MAEQPASKIETASRAVRMITVAAFAAFVFYAIYEWLAAGRVVPLWLMTLIAGIGMPAVAETVFPSHDARSMIVWTGAILAGSLMLCSVQEHAPYMGFAGGVLALLAFAVTVPSGAKRKS